MISRPIQMEKRTDTAKDWSGLCSVLREPHCESVTEDVVSFSIHLEVRSHTSHLG